MNVTLLDGLEQPFALTKANAGPLLLIVTLTGFGGAACKPTLTVVSVSKPTVTFPMVMLGVVTTMLKDK